MTTTTPGYAAPETPAKVRRHPVLGFFAGLLLGLGVILMLFVYGLVPMTWIWLVVGAVAGAAVGVVLAYLAPARHRAPPPTPTG
ncbi:MAG: hypothetical protein R2737_18030 [Candidatus Nanopelagicales bacterium]